MEQTTHEIVKIDNMIQQVINADTLDDVLHAIRTAQALKDVLKRAKMFNELSIKYAKLYAYALVRAMELGGENELKGSALSVARWLYSMSAAERDIVINKCENGETIYSIHRQEFLKPHHLDRKIGELNDMRKDIIDEVSNNGIVNMDNYISDVYEKLGNNVLANEHIDGTRNALRLAGAIGIGDGTHIYVMPSSENTPEINRAVALRISGIIKDLDKIAEIIRISNTTLYSDQIIVEVTKQIGTVPPNLRKYMNSLIDIMSVLGIKKKRIDVDQTLKDITLQSAEHRKRYSIADGRL